MPLSRYIKIYQCEDDPDIALVYSTKQTSKAYVPKETLIAAENGDLSREDEKTLKDLSIIVDDLEEEKKDVLAFRDKKNTGNTVLSITIMLNLDCNLACIYCFEEGMKGKLYMTEETEDMLTGFIRQLLTEDIKTLDIDFYGGEPLLSLDRLKSISKNLKAICTASDIAFDFSITTNGTLFTRRIAEELVPLGLRNVRITLDGLPETHNRCRPFKSGAGSFQIILKNIKDTCGITGIEVGGNYQKDNFREHIALLDYLISEGLTPDKFSRIKFGAVMRNPDNDSDTPCYDGGFISVSEPWLAEADIMLKEALLSKGFPITKTRPIYCMIESKNSYTVYYDGTIYKCQVFVGKKGFEAGHVKTGLTDYSEKYNLNLWKTEECLDCVYLPHCFGGCRYMSYIRDGHVKNIDCQKQYLDSTLETLIKQDIKYNLTT